MVKSLHQLCYLCAELPIYAYQLIRLTLHKTNLILTNSTGPLKKRIKGTRLKLLFMRVPYNIYSYVRYLTEATYRRNSLKFKIQIIVTILIIILKTVF